MGETNHAQTLARAVHGPSTNDQFDGACFFDFKAWMHDGWGPTVLAGAAVFAQHRARESIAVGEPNRSFDRDPFFLITP